MITMDADLQDSPDEIPELYRMITEDGYDLVSGWKQKRYDPLSKTLPVSYTHLDVYKRQGSHSDAPIAFQAFMIRPVGAPSFREGLRMGAEVFQALKKVLKDRGLSTAVGAEGGFAPNLEGTEDALHSIIAAIKAAGYEPGKDVMIEMCIRDRDKYGTIL